ncbi:MAG: hypothetical protein H0W87_01325 [Actinobacteria bacterium]|nr:hypothetical protein [Actinomycetota bacterium]
MPLTAASSFRVKMRRVHAGLATIAVAAILLYGFAGHGPLYMNQDGMTGAAGICLLVVTLLGCVAAARPEAHRFPLSIAAVLSVGADVPRSPDGRARASPRILQRFRN